MRAPIPASIQELSAFFCTCGHLGAFCTLLYLRTSESSMRAPIHRKSSMCFDICMKAHSLLEIGIGIGQVQVASFVLAYGSVHTTLLAAFKSLRSLCTLHPQPTLRQQPTSTPS